ncbi:MAG: hypothetical protein IJU40_04390 [Desulfovibrionaceae bacterium]|nr:hypothetical protein [Desulfovibrionaceae bacterium]
MLHKLYEFHSEHELLEVVDSNNKLLALMPKSSVLAKKLSYRSVILLLKEANKKSLFKINQDNLEVPYLFDLPVGQSSTSLAEKFETDFEIKANHLLKLALLKPSSTRPYFAEIIGLVFQGQELTLKVVQDTNLILLDQVEFQGLRAQDFKLGPLLEACLNFEQVREFLNIKAKPNL